MDENLVIHAVQFKNHPDFKYRYLPCVDETARDELFALIAFGQDDAVLENLAKVTMIVRVETEV